MVIASLALVFLNIYSASNTRELMFQAKYASMQDKIQVIASSFETADTLSAETVDQVISVLGDINVSRLLITDGEAKVLYDSSVRQNAVGQYALLEAVVQALGGSDVFHCAYHAGALQSFAAVPIMSRATPIGCVYVMDFDAEQGEIIENLERNILRGSWILLGGIVACSAIFSVVSSKRMRKILMSMRRSPPSSISSPTACRSPRRRSGSLYPMRRTSSKRRWPPSSCCLIPFCRTIWTRTRCGSSSATLETSQTA